MDKEIQMQKSPKLNIDKWFTKNEKYLPIEWTKTDILINDEAGKPLFTQKDSEFPSFYSGLSKKIISSRYFYGEPGTEEREKSLKQLIGRVTDTFKRWGLKQGYFNEEDAENFRQELAALNINQKMAFNSPVWFNVGTDRYIKEPSKERKDGFRIDRGRVIPLVIGEDHLYPQTSACFIQSVDDTMEDIMDLAKREATLFKHGSGTGTDLSTLRSSREKLSGGGKPSGPLAYLTFYDKVAGIVKSGGKTRRAAKMNSLRIDHPDIKEFIEAKMKEQKKIEILMDNGVDGMKAINTVSYQNANLSVRVTDEFMNAVENIEEYQTKPVHNKDMVSQMPKYSAKEILNLCAQGTHGCGDPGLQYHDTINKWHTCPNSAPINASNPCVTGDTKILTKGGKWKRIDSIIDKNETIITNTGSVNKSLIKGSFMTGKKPIYRLETKNGYEIKLTADHKVFTVNRGFVPACELTKDDHVLVPETPVSGINEVEDKKFYQLLGVYLGDGYGGGSNRKKGIVITMDKVKERGILEDFSEYISKNYERLTHKNTPASVQIVPTSGKYAITNTKLQNKISEFIDLKLFSHQKRLSDKIFELSLGEQKYLLQGLFTADGTVANYGIKSQYVSLDSTSLQLLKDVQILLLGFGIKSKIYKNRRAGKNTALLPDGKNGLKEYLVKEMHSLRISKSSRIKFEKLIGFMDKSKKAAKLKKLNETISTYYDYPVDSIKSLTYLGKETVYDLTEPLTHTFVANGITIHNCSEYVFVNNSSCNLASLNLRAFVEKDGSFNTKDFANAIRLTAIAQDLEFDNSSFPTKKVAENSHKFRPLGMGYANLGALLMSLGLPYDSEEGRNIAAAITAFLTGRVYEASTEMAEKLGVFEEFEKNKEPMLKVMNKHKMSLEIIDREKLPKGFKHILDEAKNIWERVIERGKRYGFRNAQATVLAPTGTIGFMMDCDTKGIEPEIGLVQTKLLAEGGTLKIVNGTVKLALEKLGYEKEQINEILNYIRENETIEGSSIKKEHLQIFDCSNKPSNGERTIDYMGHIKMMAAVQPFLSGAISKTVNMSKEATIEEIEQVYVDAWKRGLKAIAIYRDGSKRLQPLSFKKKEEGQVPVRKKLPVTASSIRHKFNVAGHEGYLHIGIYDDGMPGEIFITMSKQGATMGGLMDSFATSLSMNLQYGVPLETLVNKFKNQRFQPSGMVWEGKKEIKTATSIVDYISKFLEKEFLNGNTEEIEKTQERIDKIEKKEVPSENEKGGFCPVCGAQMIKKGSCEQHCPSCSYYDQTGCGG